MTLREFVNVLGNEPYDITFRTMTGSGTEVDYNVDIGKWIDKEGNEYHLDVWDIPVAYFFFDLENGNIVLNIIFGVKNG